MGGSFAKKTAVFEFSILAKPHQLHWRFRLVGGTLAGETPLVSQAALRMTAKRAP
jgi:hypothetical protein